MSPIPAAIVSLLLANFFMDARAEEQPANPSASAAHGHVEEESTGTRFELTTRVEGTTYRCLGAGVRKVLFFKAYAAAFCLDERSYDKVVNGYISNRHPGKSGDALAKALEKDQAFFEHLEGADVNKLVIMQLVRNVSKDRIAGAFRSSLKEVLPEDRVEKLIATIPGDGKNGQRILLYSRGPALVIDIAGEAKRVEDELIAKKLWRVWLGPDSVTPSLKPSIAKGVTP